MPQNPHTVSHMERMGDAEQKALVGPNHAQVFGFFRMIPSFREEYVLRLVGAYEKTPALEWLDVDDVADASGRSEFLVNAETFGRELATVSGISDVTAKHALSLSAGLLVVRYLLDARTFSRLSIPAVVAGVDIDRLGPPERAPEMELGPGEVAPFLEVLEG